MNRVSLLNILDHASGISEAEVRELEQLAAAFPYCQTAHLLLAKAAHDRGSMLASQRLRRAATYAADRELLRYLIELPAPEMVAPPVAGAAEVAPASEALAVEAASAQAAVATAEPELPAGNAPATAVESAPAEDPAAAPAIEDRTPELPAEDDKSDTATTQAPDMAVSAAPADLATDTAVPTETAALTAEQFDATEAAVAPELAVDDAVTSTAEESAPAAEVAVTPEAAEAVPVVEPEPALAAESAEVTPGSEPTAEPEQEPAADSTEAAADALLPVTEEAAEASEEVASEAEEALPTAAEVLEEASGAEPEPLAPAAKASTAVLTPAASAETAAASALLAAAAGLAPEVADELPPAAPPIRPPVEAGSSRFEFGLSEAPIPTPAYLLPELPAEEPAPAAVPPFRADEQLAYALSGSSRLGHALTLRDAELTHDLPAAAEWHPDAAVLAHIAANRPAPPPAPSSLALIDRFLRSQPRIKSAATRPTPTSAPQADLSVRSTSAAPSLASESLAKIMVRQGKIGRAIEIYEQLMQRQPEKKAYFAAQIDLLTQQPE